MVYNTYCKLKKELKDYRVHAFINSYFLLGKKIPGICGLLKFDFDLLAVLSIPVMGLTSNFSAVWLSLLWAGISASALACVLCGYLRSEKYQKLRQQCKMAKNIEIVNSHDLEHQKCKVVELSKEATCEKIIEISNYSMDKSYYSSDSYKDLPKQKKLVKKLDMKRF